jgi:hypothetical protein
MYSQELRMMPISLYETNSNFINVKTENFKESSKLTLIKSGGDLYNLQLANYEMGSFSFGIKSRIEEELPYENTGYDYAGFYYLDVGINYVIKNFTLGLSLENILNLNNDDFSIDPIIEQSNGMISNYYFSHETDSLISMTVSYSF